LLAGIKDALCDPTRAVVKSVSDALGHLVLEALQCH
jgi:hypothetical protein